MSFDGKIGIVTGGTGGLGLEIARELARNGATVVITSRKKSKLQKARKLIGNNCYGFQLDVSKKKSLLHFAGTISKYFNNVDILINNAGFPFERKIWFKNVHNISEIELMNIIRVDLVGSFRITGEILKIMMKRRKGVIISISSTPAISGHNCGSPYSIAKAGLISLTKHIAIEYGQYNIRSYSVALGDIDTQAMRRSLSKKEILKAKNENTMKRLGRPEEIAKSIVSLAGENFSFLTGNTIIIDGGKVII
ncbi:MAG: SDR family NAD(P)-dependent oxidoreductase [Nitrososphaerota archaeon]